MSPAKQATSMYGSRRRMRRRCGHTPETETETETETEAHSQHRSKQSRRIKHCNFAAGNIAVQFSAGDCGGGVGGLCCRARGGGRPAARCAHGARTGLLPAGAAARARLAERRVAPLSQVARGLAPRPPHHMHISGRG